MNELDLINVLIENLEMSEVIELSNEMSKNPDKFIKRMNYALFDICKDLNKCPKCGKDLEITNSYMESRGEFWGMPVHEEIYQYGCINCNYEEY